jgi:RND family efflux transporter MFP subunit
MIRRIGFVGVALALALAAAAHYGRQYLPGQVAQLLPGASAQPQQQPQQRGQGGGRVVPVIIATAIRKEVPVKVDSLGTVTPIAAVAIKSRVETTIMQVHFEDGAFVKKDELLFTLDSRQLEAQVRQADGLLARERATLEGAERDFARYTDLAAKNATTQVNVDNAKTQTNIWRAAVRATEATLESLKVQLDYHRIRAPIAGKISAASVKVGNFVRPADAASLATIVQIAPIYVSFSVPQRLLPDVRGAAASGSAEVRVTIPGEGEPEIGKVTMIDNAVDSTSGMVSLRATMGNPDGNLWPGTLVNTQLTLRTERAVTVPAAAVQVGQGGSYVFVVKNGAAAVQPVTVARVADQQAVISKGLEGGETIVTDGQLLLADGVRVNPRPPKAGS